jgi:UDP-glucose:glycoprotein glucosyltransferase
MCQRLSPLLRVLRDSLQLPVTLVLTPRTNLDADSKAPITSFYRFVSDPSALQDASPPKALFSNLPMDHTLTLRMDVPESWDIQQSRVVQDTDNLRCDVRSGCSDEAHSGLVDESTPIHEREHITHVEYGLNSLLIFGQCYETKGSSPNGLQLTLTRKQDLHLDLPNADTDSAPQEIEVGMDGTVQTLGTLLPDVESLTDDDAMAPYSDTLVMKTAGYWQLRATPGVWKVQIAKDSKGAEIFDIVDGVLRRGTLKVLGDLADNTTKQVVMKDFVNRGELLLVRRRKGFEKAKLFATDSLAKSDEDDVIHVFSLATGHLYERFLKIMMLSVTKRTSTKVKFWLFENFLSPSFKASARYMAEKIGCEVEFVTYKWPEWLRGQSEKQRIIWGYKILFLDVLFPLSVKKIIYVDADQVVRADLKELWDMDLEGAPYGYTPMCTSRESTRGFAFWTQGFWESHLRGRPYHISALYVVDLELFRRQLVGDQLRSIYQQLSADPNSLANLDQDLPNYAQHSVPIFSLPQVRFQHLASATISNVHRTICTSNFLPFLSRPLVSTGMAVV